MADKVKTVRGTLLGATVETSEENAERLGARFVPFGKDGAPAKKAAASSKAPAKKAAAKKAPAKKAAASSKAPAEKPAPSTEND